MASPESLSNDLVNSIIRKMLQRWNTPLAQMTMWNVLRCQVDLLLLSLLVCLLIGVAVAMLSAAVQCVTR
jgi:flagellar biosynthesis protein FliQ